MFQRDLSNLILEMAQKMPIISITGPRQSGKTTLARNCFPNYRYVNLESPDIRLAASEDPRAFLNHHSEGLIIDEAQRLPDLFSYLQVISDEKARPGEFILTGSQNFLMMRSITQSLAGRVFLAHLLPLSLHELQEAQLLPQQTDTLIWKGGYPRIYDKGIDPPLFYPSYIQTYLERDIASLVQPGNLLTFRKFMELLAGRTGQLINFSALATETGVDYKTIQSWCSLLEASHILFFLRPYHTNFSKRLVKTPKLYFYDTGLACSLLGIRQPEDMPRHWARGALFENMVIAEVVKSFYHKGQRPPIFFWRDNKGLEIDLLIETVGKLKAVEIKSGTTFQPDFLKNLEAFSRLTTEAPQSYLLYGGEMAMQIREVQVLPWQQLASVLT